MAKPTSKKEKHVVNDSGDQNAIEVAAEVVPSFNELVETSLKRYDEVTPKIEELKKEYLPLKVKGGVFVNEKGKICIEDEEGYKKVADGLKFVVSKRTAVDDRRKFLKADSLEFGRRVDARAKEITEMLSPIEEHLRNQKLLIDNLIKEKEKEIEEKKNQQKIERHNRLIKANMKLVGNEYIWDSRVDLLGQETLPAINLEILDDEDFETFVADLEKKDAADKEQYEAAQKAKEEQERKIKEDADKLRQEQDKLQKEIKEMKDSRYAIRTQELLNLGLGTVSFQRSFLYINLEVEMYVPIITEEEVYEMPAPDWSAKIVEIKEQIEQLKLEAEAKAIEKKNQLEESIRLKEQEDKRLEDERIQGLNDQEKFKDYINRLMAVKVPEGLKTKKYVQKIGDIEKALKANLSF